jgi:hypothetical protein
MRSLQEDLDEPRVDTLLTAIDGVVNSNTLLLKARVDECIHAGNCLEVTDRFIRSPLFVHMMRSADRARRWGNLQNGRILPDAFDLTMRDMDEQDIIRRLRSLLTDEEHSPYRKCPSKAHADRIVDGFLDWLYRDRLHRARRYAPWSFHDLQPNFLHHSGYYTNEEPISAAAFFDGGSSDTAIVMHRGDTLLLLLTNGSP